MNPDFARQFAVFRMVRLEGGRFAIELHEDDKRVEAAEEHLDCVVRMSGGGAGCRVFHYEGTQEQVDNYIKHVIDNRETMY